MVNDSERSDLGASGASNGNGNGNGNGRVWIAVAAVVVVAAAAGVIWMRGDGSDGSQTVTAGDASDGAGSESPTGTIRVHLEPVDGFFTEGFELGLRFETADGEVIAKTLWSDHVASLGETDLDAYYDSILEQRVPAGTALVRAEVNLGIGPPPSVPDLDGDLPCRLEVQVEPEQVVDVEVSFDGGDDCLRQITDEDPDPAAPGSTVPIDPSTSAAPPSSASRSTTSAPVPPDPAPDGGSLAVGTSHHVDVDLECAAFVLEGTWVLVDGDPSTWQPPGERHEGGTFTIESPDQGRFVGDAGTETKVATFRRLGPTEEPACPPAPRPRPPG